MDRDSVLRLLPDTYARALRLREAGSGQAEIARELRIEPEAVAAALELADAKLARLLEQHEAHHGS